MTRTAPALLAALLTFAALALLAPGQASAQGGPDGDEGKVPIKLANPEDAPAEEKPAEEKPAEEKPVEEKPAEETSTTTSTTGTSTATAQPAADGAASSTEGNLYWGSKRDVAIVQKRIFAKDGRLEFTAFGGLIPNDPFLTYIPVGGRVSYYFLESISVELAGAFTGEAVQLETDLSQFLKNNEKIRGNTDLLDRQQWRANAVIVWSPFYGKLAMVDSYLSHFDINLAAGLGVVQTESPRADRSGFDTEIKPEGALGAGFRFFLTDFLALRIDYRQGIFQKVGGGVSTPSELTLGFSFFTGG